ncbi:MAG: hypothetical protein RLO81_15655 [Fulvivirga sp.]|uniref:hypothetical protein n=1 Tax=Fulvivirga sp. TaxID=1931237 RepID=UPI0032EF25CD
MKKLLITSLCLASLCAFAQDKEESYVMYEMITLQMNGKDNGKLQQAMKAHNDAFHNKEGQKARVWAINSGPNAGKTVWMMGPLTFADLDNRPQGKNHDDDWKNVAIHVESLVSVEYWQRDDELSVVKDKEAKNLYVRFSNVSDETGFLTRDFMEKVSAVQKALDRDHSWTVWDNQFRQGNRGRHMATAGGFDKWAELDEDWGFKNKFIEIYGEDKWVTFWRTGDLIFTDQWDETWTYMPEMSSK